MKKLGIYFSDADKMGYPFHKENYLEAYIELIEYIEKEDIEVYIVRGESYLGLGNFKLGYRYENGDFVAYKNIKVDLIFNRDDKNTIPYITDCKIINHPEFDALCVDKMKTFKRFPGISANTAYIHSYEECSQVIDMWGLKKDDLVVLKKNFETEGRGIFIIPMKEIREELYVDWSHILVQEFVDASVGIPGIVEGIHDIRLNIVNGEIANAFVRVPKEGSYLANYALGGKISHVDMSSLPGNLKEMVKNISSEIKEYFPFVFAADFMNSSKGFRLVELNSRPGLQHISWVEDYYLFNSAVANMLIRALKE